jgi:hypothetical protein
MRDVKIDKDGKVMGATKIDIYNSIDKTNVKSEDFKYENPNEVQGEGYPHGVIWINGKDKKHADAMIVDTGDACYEFWARINPKRIPRTSLFIRWKHLFDFHDYELEELALNVLERIPDEVYKIVKEERVQ